ncbi:MAG: hypothetical protein JWO09_2344 [Bacteroidetes bacterium]|nr:hypothetical protein [Bacteroidota bacterium]
MKILSLTFYFIVILTSTVLSQDVYLDKGNQFLNSGNLDSAEQIFRKGIISDPQNLIYQNQLALILITQKKFDDAENVLEKVLKTDSLNAAAVWYSGIGNFKSKKYRPAIKRFEKALLLIDKKGGQYYSANWFIGKSYSNLLKTEGLTYSETDRMLECLEAYIRLQPDAEDTPKIKEYVERKKARRPPNNVEIWVDL